MMSFFRPNKGCVYYVVNVKVAKGPNAAKYGIMFVFQTQ